MGSSVFGSVSVGLVIELVQGLITAGVQLAPVAIEFGKFINSLAQDNRVDVTDEEMARLVALLQNIQAKIDATA